MNTITELIVLHTTKYSETSLVIHTLSREYGRRSFIVKGLGKSKGAAMALFLPMNILECEVVESPKSKLWLARNFSAKYPLNGIRSNMYKNSITLFISEVLFKNIKEGGLEEGLYEWACRQTLILDAMQSNWSNFHLRFLLELAGQLGFAPSEDDLIPFAGNHLQHICDILEKPFAEAMLVPMSGACRNEIADSLIDYIAYHSESAININSLRVLREIFA